MPDPTFMELALKQARLARDRSEVPVGAVLVHRDRVIAESGNRTLAENDATAHAEMIVLRRGGEILRSARLPQCDLYVTLEPCAMCAAAISHGRIRRLYFGAQDLKGGAVENGVRFFDHENCHHKPEIYGGICEEESARILRDFFKSRR